MDKVACTACGVMILPTTAAKNQGKCIPCSKGTREGIEASRQWYRDERELDRSDPARLHWRVLAQRVNDSEAGFDGLSKVEKQYYAVFCLDGQVHNGGFEQFFGNSTGSFFSHALEGLRDAGAEQSLALLQQARQAIFDLADVPVDTEARRELMRMNASPSRAQRVDALDELYWKDPDALAEKLDAFARRHHFY